MSSQTTDTPGTTTTITVTDRSGATFQTYPNPDHFANPQSCEPPAIRTRPTQPERTKRRPDQALKFRGLAASGSQLSAGLPLGDLENNTPTTPPPQPARRPRQKPRQHGPKRPAWHPTRRSAVVSRCCVVRHRRGSWQHRPPGPDVQPQSAAAAWASGR